jgi:hypothetical protein
LQIRTSVRVFACVLPLAAALGGALRAQEPAVPPQQLRLREFLLAAYPDLDGRALQIRMSPGVGALAFSVRDVTDSRDIVKRAAGAQVLEGTAQFDARGVMRAFAAGGALVKSAENLELARAVVGARRAGRNVDAEIDRRNPRFGLGRASVLLAHLDFAPFEARVGTVTIESATPRPQASETYGFVWDIGVVLTPRAGPGARYILSFEPFDGRLVSVVAR